MNPHHRQQLEQRIREQQKYYPEPEEELRPTRPIEEIRPTRPIEETRPARPTRQLYADVNKPTPSPPALPSAPPTRPEAEVVIAQIILTQRHSIRSRVVFFTGPPKKMT